MIGLRWQFGGVSPFLSKWQKTPDTCSHVERQYPRRWSIQRVSITEINYAICWIVIYPVDSAIQRLNNRGQCF